MLWISPGTFTMGSPDNESGHSSSERQFAVTITDGFWLSKYPITVMQWHAGLYLGLSVLSPEELDYPITEVNWYETLMFCWELNRLQKSLLARLEPLEYHFILPLEAQWEYACRANSQSRLYNDNTESDPICWYSDNSGNRIHTVGEKKPNSWGLYDMLGNVHEWCLDSYTDYPIGPEINWKGNGDGFVRTMRGGSYADIASDIRCACRGYMEPVRRSTVFGFRLCLSNVNYSLNL